MKETELEIRKRIDLHYGRLDFSDTLNYVEYSYYCCFDELFNVENTYWETELNGNEIFEILDALNIQVDKEYLKTKYSDSRNHDVEVFHSNDDEQVFAYFDLQKDPSDQNGIFYLGISCTIQQDDIICDKLRNIYKKLKTTSPFTYDRLNNVLYNKVFRSYFYFYDNEYNSNKRQLNHHKNSR